MQAVSAGADIAGNDKAVVNKIHLYNDGSLINQLASTIEQLYLIMTRLDPFIRIMQVASTFYRA